MGLRLFVADLNAIEIKRPAPAEPFNLPIVPFDSLLHFHEQGGAINQVKVRGVVTFSKPGEGLYIQDGDQGLLVQSGQAKTVAVGSRIEAAGYPAAGRYSPILDNAVFRLIGTSPPVMPLVRSAKEMIAVSDGFSSAPYDSVLVQLQGKLIEELVNGDEDRLLLQDGNTVFTARLPLVDKERHPLTPGSLLSLTGVCAANADESHEVRSFEILVSSPAEIVLLKKAPWWTASHAAWIVGLLIALLCGMFGWFAVIKRQSDLRALAVTDPLTGLYNRRGFLLLAEQQWRLALRGDHPFLLFYIDVDEFKKINDTFGHNEGDVALRTIAGLLRQCFRKADILGRLGGDEFAVTAIQATDPSRETLERRILTALENCNEKLERPFQLSLSLGILTCDASLGAISIEDLLARADALMYQAKRSQKSKHNQPLAQ